MLVLLQAHRAFRRNGSPWSRMTFHGTPGSQGDRLTRPRSLYCHSLGKAGRRACVSCHQMLVIMTKDEMCYFQQSHGRQKGTGSWGVRSCSGFGSRSLCSYPGILRPGACGSPPMFCPCQPPLFTKAAHCQAGGCSTGILQVHNVSH